MIPWLICALCATPAPAPGAADVAWRDVLPPPGDPHEHPPLRALVLGRQKPEDVVETVAYRGTRRRYGQLRYGSPSSVRVTIVLDEDGAGAADLYVDADRDRRIEPGDRVAGEDRTWRVPLKVAVVTGESTSELPRAVIFRLGSTGLTFSSAAAGYLEGTVRLGARLHRARRMDGDGNGLLTDAQDRIWIDRDDDGRWDAATEQFLFAPILPIGGERYAVNSDELGRRLALEPLEGTGTVRIALNRPEGAARVAELSATLIGHDGSAVGLQGVAAEAMVPVGEYRVGTLLLSLEDPAGGPRWNFVFAAEGARGEPTWYRVEKGGTTAIDPIGVLALSAGVEGDAKGVRPGDDVRVQPGLYTGNGLLIVTCDRGHPTTPSSDGGPGAAVAVRGAGDRTLATAHSGFA